MKKKHQEDWDKVVISKEHLKIFTFNVEAFVSKKSTESY